jgi:hypothetical protein
MSEVSKHDLAVDGKIIEINFREIGCKLDLTASRSSVMLGFCKHGNELSDSIKAENLSTRRIAP